jgi:hypothetical protein
MPVNAQKQSTWVVPKSLFRTSPGGPANPRFAAESFAAHEARVSVACNISMRVGWDGDPDRCGNVEIKTTEGWCQVQNLDTENGLNDLIFPAIEIEGEALMVDFERGPEHVQRAFKVRAIPIEWKDGLSPPNEPNASYVAKRDEDYNYREDPASAPWCVSVPSEPDGVQRSTLLLPKGVCYEVWIDIQHPTDDALWKEHDPIVRTGEGQPGANEAA